MYYSESDFTVASRVEDLAARRGVQPAQVALAWLLSRPGVTAPIIGASRMEQLEQSVAALDLTLSTDECTFLEDAYVPHRVLGHS